MSESSSEAESEEPPAKKTPGKYKVSLLAQVNIQPREGWVRFRQAGLLLSPGWRGEGRLPLKK